MNQSQRLENLKLYRAVVGPLTIWLRREGEELFVATERDADESLRHRDEPLAMADSEPPTDSAALAWDRYILASNSQEIGLRYLLPDRPLVARPESVLVLPPGRHATFYFGIPLRIAVVEAALPPVTLTELPTIVLSNIWFGDPMQGELCYSLMTRAKRDVDLAERRPYRAICTLEIRNESDEPIKVQRLRVSGPNLDLFEGEGQVWTNRVVARFRSQEQGSEVEVVTSAPTSGLRKIVPAREPVVGSVVSRVLGMFRREESIDA
ncbi:DUF432 domain-containing protein [Mucisphaera sp.]|uniref:DUF432 domain-containing protein n=1 Tax=Mucisphaera sp. TaxID=2913024 RepID=UPI003D0AD492